MKAKIMEYEGSKVMTIPIPDGATNGDIIKAMFPNIEIEGIGGLEGLQCVAVGIGLGTSFFALDWWNAPYRKVEE